GGNLNFEPPVGRNVIPSANARPARTEGFRRETFELTLLGSLDFRSGRREMIGVIRRESGPCGPLRGPRSDLAAGNRAPPLRVELHLLAAPAEPARRAGRPVAG